MSTRPLLSGKVREIYAAGDDRLAMVASDRISAYDQVLPTPIPDKGRVLTGLSRHWFAHTADIVPNHLLSIRSGDMPEHLRGPRFAGRTMLVRRLEMLPIECVARGYLAGSGWRDYRDSGAICGHRLPVGLREAERLAEPIFTPATKAESGHDENITREEAAQLVGGETLAELERVTLALYTRAAAACAAASIILADTKFELGRDPHSGEVVLGDEAVTPDSSRLWPADRWAPGSGPPSFDKQYVRDWLDASGWDHSPPAPALPDEVVRGTRARYIDAYERITGESFAEYLREGA
jgi:phosphoribosylaminoimidazole-succinocarboxamide synthase